MVAKFVFYNPPPGGFFISSPRQHHSVIIGLLGALSFGLFWGYGMDMTCVDFTELLAALAAVITAFEKLVDLVRQIIQALRA